MTTIRTGKNKGSQFEMNTKYSLSFIFDDIIRLGSEGFQAQYDLQSKESKVAIECKRLRGFSWNELVKVYEKLVSVAPEGYCCYLIFQGNRQPPLVFLNTMDVGDGKIKKYQIMTFEDLFKTPFEKHPSTRVKKDTHKVEE